MEYTCRQFILLFVAGCLCRTGSGDSKVVCYLPNFQAYRTAPWAFAPDDVARYLDPSPCTHINLAFSSISSSGDGIVISEPDQEEPFYKALTSLRSSNPNLKVLTALGGYVDSGNSKVYSTMMASPSARGTFIQNAKKFVQDRSLDGLDVDWEYPTCWQGDCDGHDDKANFATFIKELSSSFHQSGLLVTAAVSNDPNIIKLGYDVQSLSDDLDFINVMCYDYNNYRNNKTGLNAPLGTPDQTYSAAGGMAFWTTSGASASKLVLGLPLYGKAFTLSDPSKHDLGDPTSGQGKGAFVTDEDVPYFQICQNVVNNGWSTGSVDGQGSYAYKNDQWVGYDSPQAVVAKVRYVKEQGYGGIMVWDISQDDFRGDCCGLKYPIMNAINLELSGNGQDPTENGCK